MCRCSTLYPCLNIEDLHRIERIFRIAAANQAEVLILGAFGCGAFCNPPEIVAKAFQTVLNTINLFKIKVILIFFFFDDVSSHNLF